MNKHDLDKAYVSPIDKFLHQFDADHEKSASQLKEIKKYERINALRDNPNLPELESEIWRDF
ncbi:hypothetical protein Lrub_0283 [Legionella rubrilucens]|uniref:Uncharacterized protein n=1 Tax=Legionella rubrilucens TaxID=458 RepID=A0A0W0XYE4_9GAMM|nr:CBU_0585 family protein [Legionella rubrilucens]KTD49841.1 hypothetical protein Lrub_0283 [Legionella rubrilucens]